MSRPAAPPAVAVSVARLDRSSGWRRFSAEPEGPGWVWLDDRLADGEALDGWVRTERGATAGGHADLAGALIVYRLAGHLAELAVGCLADQGRAFPLDPGSVALRFGDAARLDELAAVPTTVAVLPGDPAAADVVATPAAGVVVVPTVEALRAVAAEGLVTTFGPVAAAVRARAPFGLRGMWGTLADHVAEVATRRARDRGGDVDAALDEADLLIDAVAERVPALRTRPRRQAVDVAGGRATVVTKGTCCLIYKAGAPPGVRGAAARLVGSAACTSCPLRPEADRARRFAGYLAGLPGGGVGAGRAGTSG